MQAMSGPRSRCGKWLQYASFGGSLPDGAYKVALCVVLGVRAMRVMSLASILFFLTACSSPMTMDEQVEYDRRRALSELDIMGCLMAGKVIAAGGMFATPACIELHSDGGKICQDSAECEGLCTSKEVIQNGMKATGFCQLGFKDPSCYNEISHGVAKDAICED